MGQPKLRPEQLADAYTAVARVNHYMVGIVETVTADERDDAEQILIRQQNGVDSYAEQNGIRNPTAFIRRQHTLFSLALDVLEHDRNAARAAEREEGRAAVRELPLSDFPRFHIDGTTEGGEYDGGTDAAPYAVFDSERQENIIAGLPVRWMAVAIAREAIKRHGNTDRVFKAAAEISAEAGMVMRAKLLAEEASPGQPNTPPADLLGSEATNWMPPAEIR